MDANQNSRRRFIKTASATALLAIGTGSLPAMDSGEPFEAANGDFKTGFDQQPLPYSYNALEPAIDATTMEIHFSKHAAAYAKNLKEAAVAEKVDMQQPVETLLGNIAKYSAKMRNNGGGHYNHELFWQSMRAAKTDNMATGPLLSAIEKSFTNFNAFKTKFADAGKNRFGSGWAWLYIDKKNQLAIGSTANQDNPLMNIKSIDCKGFPLLGLDVWEHAYYLKYQNKRADYIENWWQLVNWDYVSMRYESTRRK